MNNYCTPHALSFVFISSKSALDSFKCRENQESEEIEQFLKRSALFYHQEGLARTVLALNQEVIVGYYSLAMGSVVIAGPKKGSMFSREEATVPRHLPSLLLARMGVHQDYRRSGIGRAMMNKIITLAADLSECIGFRFILVDSKPQAVEFYRSIGFEENGSSKYKGKQTTIMTLDLKHMKVF